MNKVLFVMLALMVNTFVLAANVAPPGAGNQTIPATVTTTQDGSLVITISKANIDALTTAIISTANARIEQRVTQDVANGILESICRPTITAEETAKIKPTIRQIEAQSVNQAVMIFKN